ncbi:hypothetical protein [Sulfurovum riftiae]|nr:hypothetical protein [Sulfurovum riftiae]
MFSFLIHRSIAQQCKPALITTVTELVEVHSSLFTALPIGDFQ